MKPILRLLRLFDIFLMTIKNILQTKSQENKIIFIFVFINTVE